MCVFFFFVVVVVFFFFLFKDTDRFRFNFDSHIKVSLDLNFILETAGSNVTRDSTDFGTYFLLLLTVVRKCIYNLQIARLRGYLMYMEWLGFSFLKRRFCVAVQEYFTRRF